jgi:hypothetical protein
MNSRRRLILTAAAVFLGGCAGMRPGYERPSLMLDSFRAVPSEGMAPRFALGLRVVNPNSTPLPLRGMTFNVQIEGHRLINGVAADLETVPAYGESVIELQAGVDLISGLRLINDLLQDSGREYFRFNLKARLDTGGLSRFLVLEEAGQLSLASLRR